MSDMTRFENDQDTSPDVAETGAGPRDFSWAVKPREPLWQRFWQGALESVQDIFGFFTQGGAAIWSRLRGDRFFPDREGNRNGDLSNDKPAVVKILPPEEVNKLCDAILGPAIPLPEEASAKIAETAVLYELIAMLVRREQQKFREISDGLSKAGPDAWARILNRVISLDAPKLVAARYRLPQETTLLGAVTALGSAQNLEYLLRFDALRVNQGTRFGNALHHAYSFRRVLMLLEKGANPLHADDWGKKSCEKSQPLAIYIPLKLACDILDAMQKDGIKIECNPPRGGITGKPRQMMRELVKAFRDIEQKRIANGQPSLAELKEMPDWAPIIQDVRGKIRAAWQEMSYPMGNYLTTYVNEGRVI